MSGCAGVDIRDSSGWLLGCDVKLQEMLHAKYTCAHVRAHLWSLPVHLDFCIFCLCLGGFTSIDPSVTTGEKAQHRFYLFE